MKHNIEKVDQLYERLFKILNIGDMNYHRFEEDNRLHPIHMDEKGLIGNKKWKETHSALKIKVSEDPSLDIVTKGRVLYIEDVYNDERSSNAFKKEGFDIHTILITPIFNNLETRERILGFICIPSVGKIRPISKDEIDRAVEEIIKFNKEVIEAEKTENNNLVGIQNRSLNIDL